MQIVHNRLSEYSNFDEKENYIIECSQSNNYREINMINDSHNLIQNESFNVQYKDWSIYNKANEKSQRYENEENENDNPYLEKEKSNINNNKNFLPNEVSKDFDSHIKELTKYRKFALNEIESAE